MSLPSLLEALRETQEDVAGFFGSVPEVDFELKSGEAWSPAEHLDHLNIAASAIARGFAMSPLLLRLRFGSTKRESRTYERLRDDYLSRLAAGGRASGRFVPASVTVDSIDVSARKTSLLDRWGRVNRRLTEALGTWSERNLDRVQMPHPLLGKITARELAFFAIYHGGHHVVAARRRLE